jgi:hypothetical protein
VTTSELTQDVIVPFAEVEGSRSAAAWSVAESGWKQVLPDLPDDVIAMLATPVVVTAESLAGSVARPRAAVDLQAEIGDCTPRFLAPAPPKRIRPRHRFA